MNMTKQAATITQTVSAATPAACVAVGSSASTRTGTTAAMAAKPAAIASTGLRFPSAFQTSVAAPMRPPCALRSILNPDKDLTS